MRTHFWPFTGVLRKILRRVTRKVNKQPRIGRIRQLTRLGVTAAQAP